MAAGADLVRLPVFGDGRPGDGRRHPPLRLDRRPACEASVGLPHGAAHRRARGGHRGRPRRGQPDEAAALRPPHGRPRSIPPSPPRTRRKGSVGRGRAAGHPSRFGRTRSLQDAAAHTRIPRHGGDSSANALAVGIRMAALHRGRGAHAAGAARDPEPPAGPQRPRAPARPPHGRLSPQPAVG